MTSIFNRTHTDIISLVKQSGARVEGIKANVQSSLIVIADESLPAEDGDFIERSLPNGYTERYLILDIGFHNSASRGHVPNHFQMKVRKETSLLPGQTPSVVNTYNLHGSNTRVNIGSTDNSSNIVGTTNQALFADIRRAVETIEELPDRENLLPYVDELEAHQGSPTFLEKYQGFVTAGANHMTLIGPFIPALSRLLGVG